MRFKKIIALLIAVFSVFNIIGAYSNFSMAKEAKKTIVSLKFDQLTSDGYYINSANSIQKAKNHGTIVSSEPSLNYAYFNGVDSYVEIENSSNVEFLEDAYFEFSIFPRTNGYTRIIDKITVGAGDGFLIDITNIGRIRFIGGGTNITSANSLPLNKWSKVSVAFDYAERKVKIFINDILDFSGGKITEPISNNLHTIKIGADSSLNSNLKAKISNLIISNYIEKGKISSIVFENKLSEISINEVLKLKMSAITEKGYNLNPNEVELRIKSSDESVIKLLPNSEIKGIKKGVAVITLTGIYDGNQKEENFNIKVVNGVKDYPISLKNGEIDVNMESYLQKHDVVNRQPILDSKDGMVLGNGAMGAIVWNTKTSIDFQIGRNDVFGLPTSDSLVPTTLPSLGKMSIKSTPSDMEKISDYDQRLSLFGATLNTKIKNNSSGTLYSNIDMFVDANSDVMAIKYKNSSDKLIKREISLELWENRNPELVLENDFIGFSEKYTSDGKTNGFSIGIKVIGGSYTTKIVNDKKLLIEFTPSTTSDLQIYISTVCSVDKQEGISTVKSLINNATQKGYDQILSQHKSWWANFWKGSFVKLSNSDSKADYLEGLWYSNLYQTASAAKGNYPYKFNGGIWSHNKDDRDWGSGYWNWNTRVMYWQLLAANKFKQMEPYFNLYSSVLEKVKAETPGKFGIGGPYNTIYPTAPPKVNIKGAKFPETMLYTGEGVAENKYVFLVLSTGTDISTIYYQNYLYTKDNIFLTEKAYPLMRDVADFLISFSGEKDSNGKYNIFPANARETYWYVKNPSDAIAGFKKLLSNLLAISDKVGATPAQKAIYQDYFDNLASLPSSEDNTTLIQAELPLPADTNGENPELEAIYPYSLFGIEKPGYEKALKAFNLRKYVIPYGWSPEPIQAARLGLGNESLKLLIDGTKRFQVYANGLTSFDGNRNNTYYTEWNGVLGTTINEMLLQSYDNLIRVFPAFPQNDTWNDSKFTLRAENGFLVTSEMAMRTVKYISVKSLFGEKARVKNPWGNTVTVKDHLGRVLLTTANDVIEFNTVINEVYLIENSSLTINNYETVTERGFLREYNKNLDNVSYGFGTTNISAPTDRDKIVLQMNFDDANNKAADYSGCGNNGELVGNLVQTPGQSGMALEFDGKKSYINVQSSPSLQVTGQMSIDMWIYIKDSEKPMTLVDKTKDLGSGFLFDITEEKKLRFTASGEIISTVSLPLDKWVRVGASYASGKVKLYIDGVVNNDAYVGHFIINEQPITVGANTKLNNLFKGKIDNLRIFSYTSDFLEPIQHNVIGWKLNSYDSRVTDKDGSVSISSVTGNEGFSASYLKESYGLENLKIPFLVNDANWKEGTSFSVSLLNNVQKEEKNDLLQIVLKAKKNNKADIYFKNGLDEILIGRNVTVEINNQKENTIYFKRISNKLNIYINDVKMSIPTQMNNAISKALEQFTDNKAYVEYNASHNAVNGAFNIVPLKIENVSIKSGNYLGGLVYLILSLLFFVLTIIGSVYLIKRVNRKSV